MKAQHPVLIFFFFFKFVSVNSELFDMNMVYTKLYEGQGQLFVSNILKCLYKYFEFALLYLLSVNGEHIKHTTKTSMSHLR